ncbi:MAG: EAL domain-containing protein [Halopseudomonas sp.]|uniref:putative bifunctional diguanylate cyclase/phosphodiesterase n=1 Tax=Halopseudomonas sp. TaxID=2901191 RepID=UPI003001B1C4
MVIDLHTFNSPIARRLFLFFFLAVTLPILVLVSVIFFQLSGYAADQHRKELQQDAKYLGMSLLVGLQRVSDELPLLAENRPDAFVRSLVAGTAEKQLSVRTVGSDIDGRPAWLYPEVTDAVLYDGFIEQLSEAAQAGAEPMRIHQLNISGNTGLFVSLRLASGDYLGAQLRPEFFWDTEQLPHDKIVCVLAATDRALFCSDSLPTDFLAAFSSARANSSLGSFEWDWAQEPMRAVYWEVFLQNLGMDTNWTVVLSQPEQELFATTRRFQSTLIIIVLASILMALMFSIGHLRRVLKPLQKLRNATRQVYEGKLDKQVTITSGDEFEELAVAFNSMTHRLARQFEQREALMELDRLILSSMDSRNVVNKVLFRAIDFLKCQTLVVGVYEQGQVKLTAVRQGSEQVRASELDDATALNPVMKAFETEPCVRMDSLPDGLSALVVSEDYIAWMFFPLFISGALQGFVLAGGLPRWEAEAADASRAAQIAGRLSIALTRARWEADLYRQAHVDDLTCLPNRAALKAALSGALERSLKRGTRVALLFIDLDRFKLINDSIGHAAGDAYLQVVAQRVLECVRSEDTVSRLGGDEFTVVMADIPPEVDMGAEVLAVVNRLLETVPKPVRIGMHDLRSTLSIGVSVCPDDGQTIDDLMKQADTAMYQAKRNGGNGFRFYAQDMQDASRDRMELDNDMRHALESDQFLLYFQPQVAAASGRMQSAEVLLRWNHPERGLVPPGVFIPIAEESLLIADIDCWVLRATCRQIRQWLDAGIAPVTLAINISAAQFQNPHFVDLVKSTLAEYRLTADQIELEITEGALISDLRHAQEVLRELRAIGLRLAIDDFGTGYCSLAYLKKMPIDKLKIDQSFVRDITRSNRDAAIVDVILQLSKQLDLRCIAEGVETREELTWLLEKGCEVVQGYYFYRPMPLADFEPLLNIQ